MLNYYQILDLPDYADARAIKHAYRDKCRQYHPDRVSGLGARLRAVAGHEMALINQAYEVLGDHARRVAFDRVLGDALARGGMRPCRTCGISFSAPLHAGQDQCPPCRRALEGTAQHGPLSVRRLLHLCFIAAHHFASGLPDLCIAPALVLGIGGETLRAVAPPGPLELTLGSKALFDAADPPPEAQKQPWSYMYKTGRINWPEAHPIESAEALHRFCAAMFPDSPLQSLRFTLCDENYKSYEHLLNQSVVLAAGRVAPWTASRLIAQCKGNLVDALRTPDAQAPDAFYFAMSGLSATGAEPELERLHQAKTCLLQEVNSARARLETLRRQLRRDFDSGFQKPASG